MTWQLTTSSFWAIMRTLSVLGLSIGRLCYSVYEMVFEYIPITFYSVASVHIPLLYCDVASVQRDYIFVWRALRNASKNCGVVFPWQTLNCMQKSFARSSRCVICLNRSVIWGNIGICLCLIFWRFNAPYFCHVGGLSTGLATVGLPNEYCVDFLWFSHKYFIRSLY